MTYPRPALRTMTAVGAALACAACTSMHMSRSQSNDQQPAAQSASPSVASAKTLSDADRAFATQAAQINLLSIAGSQAILDSSTNGFVRSVAQSILDDHRKGWRDLQQIAASTGLKLPTQLDSAHQQQLDQLKAQGGADPNETYLHQIGVQAQQREIQAARQEIASGSNPQLIDFARRRASVLEAQVAMAQRLADNQRAK